MTSFGRKALYRFVFALGLLGVFLYFIGWREVAAAFYTASPLFLALGMAAGVAGLLTLAVPWRIILDQAGIEIGTGQLLKSFLACGFMNSITPLGQLGGEPFMAYVLSLNEEASYEESFAAIFSADLLTTVPFFSFSLSGLGLLVLSNSYTDFAPFMAVFILLTGVVMSVLVYMLWSYKGFATGMVKWSFGLFRRVSGLVPADIDMLELDEEELDAKIERFYATIRVVFQHPRTLIEVLVVAHASWLLSVTALYAFLVAVGWPVPFYVVLFILPSSLLASYLPLPGGLAGIEFLGYALLVVIGGVSGPAASAAFLLYRFSSFGVALIAGGISLWTMSVDIDAVYDVFEGEGMLG